MSAQYQLPLQFFERPCPTCGARAPIAGTKIAAEMPAEDQDFERIKKTWQHFFKRSLFFSYFRCGECAQLYCPRFFNIDQLVSLYSRMSDNTADLPASVVGKTQSGYFRILERSGPLKGTYLEFGPDIGLLTKECADKGSFERMILIEPNQEVHAQLALSAGAIPHAIHSKMEAYKELPDSSVDVIAMIHVLDHLLDPGELLSVLKRKLKPGGRILFVTHDEASLMAKALKSRWPAFCLQHPQLYNPASIKSALERQGFKVLAIKKTYNYFPLTYLLKHLFWALRIGKVPLPAWNWLILPLKLGNIATVASV